MYVLKKYRKYIYTLHIIYWYIYIYIAYYILIYKNTLLYTSPESIYSIWGLLNKKQTTVTFRNHASHPFFGSAVFLDEDATSVSHTIHSHSLSTEQAWTSSKLQLMEEIRLTSWYGNCPIIYRVPLGFHTCWVVVWDFFHQLYDGKKHWNSLFHLVLVWLSREELEDCDCFSQMLCQGKCWRIDIIAK